MTLEHLKNIKDKTHYTVPWPTLCDDCGHNLAQEVVSQDKLDAFVSYCPHRLTLVLAFAGEIHGSRGIIRWDIQSPLSLEEATNVMNNMAPHAARMVNLDKPRLN